MELVRRLCFLNNKLRYIFNSFELKSTQVKVMVNKNNNCDKLSQQRLFSIQSNEIDKAKQSKWSKKEKTIFDSIIEKKIPADIIYEDDKCLAFNDIAPQAPVHFLVIPKKRIPLLNECQLNDSGILAHLLLTAKILGEQRAPEGYRLVINNGVHGCQSVYHLHIHILGGRQLLWPPG